MGLLDDNGNSESEGVGPAAALLRTECLLFFSPSHGTGRANNSVQARQIDRVKKDDVCSRLGIYGHVSYRS